MASSSALGDFTLEFDVFRCMAYELTILRYTYNVIEANLVQFMIDYPDDACSGIKQALDPLFLVLERLVNRDFGSNSIINQGAIGQNNNQSASQSFGNPATHSTPIRNQTRNEAHNITPTGQVIPQVTVSPATANLYNSQIDMQPNNGRNAQSNAVQSHLDQALNNPQNRNQQGRLNQSVPDKGTKAPQGSNNISLPTMTYNPNLTVPGQAIPNRTLPAQVTDANLTRPYNADLGVTLPGVQASFNRTMTTQGNLNRTMPGPDTSNPHVPQHIPPAAPITNQPSYTLLRPGGLRPRWRRNLRNQ